MDHSGHKERLRQKALTNIDNLQQHEILELLLNYSIVRKNTNPIAHELIDKFGSIANVMDAEIPALMQIEGLGEVSASLLVLIPKLCNAYTKSKCAKFSKITCIADAEKYFRLALSNLNREEVYALCLNKNDKIIGLIKLATGDLDSINITPQKVVNEVVKLNPARIYLSHNHNIQYAYPSDSDIIFTKQLIALLKPLKIKLVDHIIISPSETFSFATSEILSELNN